jgi:methyltransferase (TIGR00027 family)
MFSQPEPIQHVSDTALMVAACRALEYDRPDPLVLDPFARRLAGERGMEIAARMAGLETMCFGVAIRSRFLDELVLRTLAAGEIRTVACLGCGLDARPWRLDLAASLRWIEVDLPAILDYKTAALAGETPKCRLERMVVDLTDSGARQALWDAIGAAPALIITEGLLGYLPSETVSALAAEGAARSGARYWLLDVTTRELGRAIGSEWRRSIAHVTSETHLRGAEILAEMARNGWKPEVHRSYRKDAAVAGAARIQSLRASRPAPSAGQEPTPAVADDDVSGVHLLAR